MFNPDRIAKGLWWDRAWNPIRLRTGGWACAKVSPGCDSCWAESMAKRFGYTNAYDGQKRDFILDSTFIAKAMRARGQYAYFVNDCMDTFHHDLTDTLLTTLFGSMYACPQHIFMVLTKRLGRMYEFISSLSDSIIANMNHIWLGASAENQKYADKRIPILLQTPAAMRFVSVEPMLGPVDIKKFLTGGFDGLEYKHESSKQSQTSRRISHSGRFGGRTGDRLSGKNMESESQEGRQMESGFNSDSQHITPESRKSSRDRLSSSSDYVAGETNPCVCPSTGVEIFSRSITIRDHNKSQERDQTRQQARQLRANDLQPKRPSRKASLGKVSTMGGEESSEQTDRCSDKRDLSSSNDGGETQVHSKGFRNQLPAGITHSSEKNKKTISLVIIGCESGPKRRPCKVEWVRDLVQQCQATNTAVFVKQLSINGKVEHDIEKFPEDLRVRELPMRKLKGE